MHIWLICFESVRLILMNAWLRSVKRQSRILRKQSINLLIKTLLRDHQRLWAAGSIASLLNELAKLMIKTFLSL